MTTNKINGFPNLKFNPMVESVFHNEPFAFANNNVKTFESIKINEKQTSSQYVDFIEYCIRKRSLKIRRGFF